MSAIETCKCGHLNRRHHGWTGRCLDCMGKPDSPDRASYLAAHPHGAHLHPGESGACSAFINPASPTETTT